MYRCLKNAWRVLHRPRVYFTVEPILLVFMFAQFLSYSAFQGFLHHRLCEENPNCSSYNTSNASCGKVSDSVEQQVQEDTSHWLLYINIATGIPAILLSMIYGSTSDVIGRRLFIALPAIGAILNTVVVLVTVYFPRVPVYVLLIGAFCNGVYGNYSVMNFAVYSYVSDVSATSGRTRQIGVLESMTYLGATLSQIVGGVWVEKTESFSGPFWCVLACHLLVLLYTSLALPESLKLNSHSKRSGAGHVQQQYHHHQTTTQMHRCCRNARKVVINIFRFLKLLFTNWKLALLISTFFIVEINFLGITDIVIIYSLGEPLCWEFSLIGYFLAAKVFMNGIASLILLPILVYMKVHDGVIVLIGLASGAAALVTMGVATHTWIMFLVPVIGAMRGCVVPCLRSMLSKVVSSDRQGVLFSGVSIVEASCTLLASVIYNALYPATLNIHPGLSFFVMATALTIPFILTFLVHLARNKSPWCCSHFFHGSQKQPLLSAHS